MNNSRPQRDYFKIWEILIFTVVTPALVYGVLSIGNVPVA